VKCGIVKYRGHTYSSVWIVILFDEAFKRGSGCEFLRWCWDKWWLFSYSDDDTRTYTYFYLRYFYTDIISKVGCNSCVFLYCLHLSKVKVKLSRYRHIGAKGERNCLSHSFLTSALVGGEWSASRLGRPFSPGKGPPGTRWIGGWVGLPVLKSLHN
jgi:hypothetical protein